MKSFVASFNAFYPHYLAAHNNRVNVRLHFVGATLFYIFLVLAIIFFNIYFLIAGVLFGYILPHIGHTEFQKNHSMRSAHPVFCVLGATRLYFSTWADIIRYIGR